MRRQVVRLPAWLLALPLAVAGNAIADVPASGVAPAVEQQRVELEAAAFLGTHLFSKRGLLGRYNDDSYDNSFNNNIAFGLRLGVLPWKRLGIEAELANIPTSTQDGHSSVMVVTVRAQAVVNLMLGRVRPFLDGGVGVAVTSPANPVSVSRDVQGQYHLGAGLRVDASAIWGLRLDARVILEPSTGGPRITQDAELLLSVYGRFPRAPVRPPPTDRDKDGITDDVDECPDEPGPPSNGGCPPGRSKGSPPPMKTYGPGEVPPMKTYGPGEVPPMTTNPPDAPPPMKVYPADPPPAPPAGGTP